MIFLPSLGNVNVRWIAFCSSSTDVAYNGSFAFKYSPLYVYCICLGIANQNMLLLLNNLKTHFLNNLLKHFVHINIIGSLFNYLISNNQ